jgi:hypothetical protein
MKPVAKVIHRAELTEAHVGLVECSIEHDALNWTNTEIGSSKPNEDYSVYCLNRTDVQISGNRF